MQILGLATHSYFIIAQILTRLLVKFCFLPTPLNKIFKDNLHFEHYKYYVIPLNIAKVPDFQSLPDYGGFQTSGFEQFLYAAN
jgi:hypothetical protein